MTFAGTDTYGEVLSGRLRIRTSALITCTVERRVGVVDDRKMQVKFQDGKAVTFEMSNDMKGCEFDEGGLYFPPVMARRRSGAGTEDYEKTSLWKSVLAPMIRGLILKSADGSSRGRFRRVGCFWDWSDDGFLSAMDDPKFWANESVYEGTAGTGKEDRNQYHIILF